MRIEHKRIYDPPAATDGYRVLVDRLWPRGVSKERAELDLWAKDLAPSPDLRKAWHHAPPEQWAAFADDYRAELAGPTSDAVDRFLTDVADRETVTLLYAAHDPMHNHAIVLEEVLRARSA